LRRSTERWRSLDTERFAKAFDFLYERGCISQLHRVFSADGYKPSAS